MCSWSIRLMQKRSSWRKVMALTVDSLCIMILLLWARRRTRQGSRGQNLPLMPSRRLPFQGLFMSRGDNSGTDAKGKVHLEGCRINPEGQKWYQQTGLGMGQTLSVAAEKKAYTLADRGTYLALKKNLGLDILNEGDAVLLNVYHVIQVNPGQIAQSEHRRRQGFCRFHGGQRHPGNYRKIRRGEISVRPSSSPMPAKRKKHWANDNAFIQNVCFF